MCARKKSQETACSLKMQQESAVKETKKFYENTDDNLNYVHLIKEKTHLDKLSFFSNKYNSSSTIINIILMAEILLLVHLTRMMTKAK